MRNMPKPSVHSLSRNETAIMKVVWETGPAGVREVHQRVSDRILMDFGTVQTYLRRLEVKGLLQSRTEDRKKVYSARTRPKKIIGGMINDLVHKLFDGNAIPLLKHLVEGRQFSKEEIT